MWLQIAATPSAERSTHTLVQAVTEGHLGQFHLWPRVVQDLPAPLERAQDALLLQPGFGTHIEPRPQNTSQNLDLTHLKLGRIVLLSRENSFFSFFYQTHPDFEYHIFFHSSNIQIQEKRTTLTANGEFMLRFFAKCLYILPISK